MDAPAPREPDASQIKAQLSRVLSSLRFRKSPRSRDFLEFIVAETLDGRVAELDQYSIATLALERAEDFDPVNDPAARMQASRVRRALEHYFLTGGASDPVLIALPPGSSRPVFQVPGLGSSKWPTLPWLQSE